MKKHKVLHVIGGGEIGGAEELVLTLLKLLDRNKYEAHLICLCEGPFEAVAAQQGFKTSTIPMKHRMDLSPVGPLRKYIQEQDISIVHTHGVRANLVARIAARKESRPVVTSVHSVLRYDYDTAAKALFARFLTRLTNSRTDRFIAISRAIEEDILGMGVPKDRITLIHNGLDISKFGLPEAAGSMMKKLGLNPNLPIIGVVARLHPVKGHEYFLQAARIMLDKGVKAQFLLVGDGIYREKLENLCRALNLEQDVFMPGYYSPVEDIYGISDLVCLPSLMEGLGMVILEAMHFNVPVVASKVGGVPEIIKDGVNGFLVEPRDPEGLAQAMTNILLDSDLRDRLCRQGQETVGVFSMESMIRKEEKIYEDLIARFGL